MDTIYHLGDSGKRRMRSLLRRGVITFLPTMFLIVFVAMEIVPLTLPLVLFEPLQRSMLLGLFALSAIVLILLHRRHAGMVDSYTIRLTDTTIAMAQGDVVRVAVARDAIECMQVDDTGMLRLLGVDRAVLICVPSYLAGFEELRGRLEERHSTVPGSVPFPQRYPNLFAVLATLPFVAIFLFHVQPIFVWLGIIQVWTLGWGAAGIWGRLGFGRAEPWIIDGALFVIALAVFATPWLALM